MIGTDAVVVAENSCSSPETADENFFQILLAGH